MEKRRPLGNFSEQNIFLPFVIDSLASSFRMCSEYSVQIKMLNLDNGNNYALKDLVTKIADFGHNLICQWPCQDLTFDWGQRTIHNITLNALTK